MDLIIVESPTKAKTLAKFLGDGYKIEASMGHVRDLPTKKLGINLQNEFEPEYVQTVKQKERLKGIMAQSDIAKNIYLATDPDREGEAIAFHVAELLKSYKSQIKNPKFQRVTFHEITKSAIESALKNPGEINMQLVDAQQARRVLDRLVGYKLSPLLWKKIRKGLSAGRVQSVAVRLVVDRENEIKAFTPEEYWDFNVKVKGDRSSVFGIKLLDEVKNQQQAEIVEKELLNIEYRVLSTEDHDFKRTPPAPFTTSGLQQTAANKMGWSAKRTIQVAQSLYEKGLITYHRTDSTNIAVEAATAARDFITTQYGKNFSLKTPRLFKTKNKVAQEAHEAIRPTVISDQLSVISDQLNRDEERLYELIWKRFVACQMAEVLGTTTKVKVKSGKYSLEAKGEVIKFEGWYKVSDQSSVINDQLPKVEVGEVLKFVSLEKLQKYTQGSARYNDASLIKALEELGIGRPSTYAPTLTTITDRQYVEKNPEKRYQPTSLGEAVNTFLVTNFSDIFDYKFTAKMEEELDEVANGEKKWQPVIHDFWDPFSSKLKSVEETSERVKVEVEVTGEKCPKCKDGEVLVRLGKFGKFLACSKFPDCDYKANWQNKTGQKCEKCKEGDVIIRKTRSGRAFYGCSNYPKCDFASWNRPILKTV